ncbi:MAG: hypothetical protein JNJ77_19505 [Planctomycetia bacterium]|nr:hypothetical protein [Planctomycetia bacterium]
METNTIPAKVSIARRAAQIAYLVALILLVILIYHFVHTDSRTEASIDFNNHALLAQRIKLAKEVKLYEGLPHQFFEQAHLASELKNKKTVTLHGFPFYADLLPLSVEDGIKLKELFCDGKSLNSDGAYISMGGRASNPDGSVTIAAKACGGFHPDYCIEWRVEGEVYQALVCFSCSELRCFGPQHTLQCDLDKCGDDSAFAKVLRKYRKNRPVKSIDNYWWYRRPLAIH